MVGWPQLIVRFRSGCGGNYRKAREEPKGESFQKQEASIIQRVQFGEQGEGDSRSPPEGMDLIGFFETHGSWGRKQCDKPREAMG